MKLNTKPLLRLLFAAPVILSGCFVVRPPCVQDDDIEHCRTLALAPLPTECPNVECRAPLSTEAPLLVDAATPPPAWDLTLDEVIRLGLENSKVLRDLGGSVLRTPALAQTIHDPAIQATDPRFGMEGALAAFDAQVTSRLVSQHNDRAYNNLFLGGGAFLFQQDLDNFDTDITKRTATGATFSLRHHVDYDANNAPANHFPSAWNTNYEAYARQPLLQGGGVDFNRIAGPNGTPGLINGVVIARINNSASTAEFEIALRDLVSNLENAYWDLYYAYRELDAKIAARDASLSTWRFIHANVQEGRGYSKLQEVQALEQYYRFQEDVVDALGGRNIDRTRTNNGSNGGTFRGVGGLHAAERRLRMWMSVPINDGKLARPTDEPPKVKIVYDWTELTREAMTRRPELRRQRAQIERAEAELVANKNFLLPQLDLIGRYRLRGFGQDWMGPRDPSDPYANALSNLTTGQFQEWELGFEYSMPLGFRRGYAAVRNAQLRLARERVILEDQERQVVHDLSAAYADTQRAYMMMELAYNRLVACQDQSRRAYDSFFELGGKVSLELVLDARIRLAEAETGYHRARIEYAVALKNVHFENGSLLEHNGAVVADAPRYCPDRSISVPRQVATDESARLNYVLARRLRYPNGEPADSASLQSDMAVGNQTAAQAATADTTTGEATVAVTEGVELSSPAAGPAVAIPVAASPVAPGQVMPTSAVEVPAVESEPATLPVQPAPSQVQPALLRQPLGLRAPPPNAAGR